MYGRPRLIQEPAALERIVDALATRYESGAVAPWRLAESNPGNLRSLRGIVGFELAADDVQIKNS